MTVLDAGREPRRALRYHLVKGTTRSVEIAMDMDVDTPGIRGPLPTVRMIGDITVEDVQPSGDMRVAMTTRDIQLRDRPGSPISTELMKKYLSALEGFTIHGTLAPTGAISQLTFDAKNLPPELTGQVDSMTQSFQQLALPLPDQPVGAGARWDFTRTLGQGSIAVTTTTHVAVATLDADAVGYHLTTDITASKGTLQEAGVAIVVDRVSGSGAGDGSVDLGSFVVTASSSTAFVVELSEGSSHVTAGQRLELTMSPVARP